MAIFCTSKIMAWLFSLVLCLVVVHILNMRLAIIREQFRSKKDKDKDMKPQFHDVLYGYKVAFPTDGNAQLPNFSTIPNFDWTPNFSTNFTMPNFGWGIGGWGIGGWGGGQHQQQQTTSAPVPTAAVQATTTATPVGKSQKVSNPKPTDGSPLSTTNIPAGKRLVLRWSDEFDPDPSLKNGGIDPKLWRFHVGDGTDFANPGWGNEEMQCYTDSPDNVAVVPMEDDPTKGKLVITALPNPLGTCKNTNAGPSSSKPFTSGKLVCREPVKWNGTAGSSSPVVVTAKIKLTLGDNSWCAFWMLPQTDQEWCSGCGKYGPWCKSGEIDILEHVNANPEVVSTIVSDNTQDGKTCIASKKTNYLVLGESVDDWHEYTLLWDSTYIKVFVDDAVCLDAKLGDWSSAMAPDNKYAPFDQPFHAIFNLAIGGTWPTEKAQSGKNPPSSAGFPYKFEIKCLRVYDVV